MAHWKALYPNQYLGAHDLQGKEVALTIRAVTVEALKTERGDERKPVLYFDETKRKAAANGTDEKRLVLNKTNAKTIAKMYGPEVNDWIGRRITVYSARVSAFGEEVDAIRVRPTPPQPETKPKPETQPQPEQTPQ